MVLIVIKLLLSMGQHPWGWMFLIGSQLDGTKIIILMIVPVFWMLRLVKSKVTYFLQIQVNLFFLESMLIFWSAWAKVLHVNTFQDLFLFQINADTNYALIFQDGSQLYDSGDCTDNITLGGDIIKRYFMYIIILVIFLDVFLHPLWMFVNSSIICSLWFWDSQSIRRNKSTSNTLNTHSVYHYINIISKGQHGCI